MLVYRAGPLLQGGGLDALARQAAELVGLLEQARRMAHGLLEQAGEFEEARAFAARMPASVARPMQRELLAHRATQADVDAFLRLSPPRKIPKNIAGYYRFSFGLKGMGVFFLVMSAVIGHAAALSGEWGAFILVAVFLSIAATMIFFGVPRFRRERRLLQRGELATAKILGLEPAGSSENGREIYRVRARHEAGGQSRRVECRAWAKPARWIAAAGKPARILYDPEHPEHILLVDVLVNSRGEPALEPPS